MTNLIEVTDDILDELNKNKINYIFIKESKTSREEMLRKAGFNPDDFVYHETSCFYFFKNPHWPVQTSPAY